MKNTFILFFTNDQIRGSSAKSRGNKSRIETFKHYKYTRELTGEVNKSICRDFDDGTVSLGSFIKTFEAYDGFGAGGMLYKVVEASAGRETFGNYLKIMDHNSLLARLELVPVKSQDVSVLAWGALPGQTYQEDGVIYGVERQINECLTFNEGGQVTIPSSDVPYYINASIPAGQVDRADGNGIKMVTNTALKLEGGVVLKVLPTKSKNYSIVRFCSGTVNSHLLGNGTVEGDRDSDEDSQISEHGHCISFEGASDSSVRDVKVVRARGDSIFVGYKSGNRNILLDRVYCAYSRRQGISVTNCDGLIVNLPKIVFIGDNGNAGTPPMSGIDLEPEVGYVVKNIQIIAPQISHCTGVGIVSSSKLGRVSEVEVLGGLIFRCKTGLGVNGVKNIVVVGTSLFGNLDGMLITGNSPSGRVQLGNVANNKRHGVNISTSAESISFLGGSFYRNGGWGMQADRVDNLTLSGLRFGGNSKGNLLLIGPCTGARIQYCSFTNELDAQQKGDVKFGRNVVGVQRYFNILYDVDIDYGDSAEDVFDIVNGELVKSK